MSLEARGALSAASDGASGRRRIVRRPALADVWAVARLDADRRRCDRRGGRRACHVLAGVRRRDSWRDRVAPARSERRGGPGAVHPRGQWTHSQLFEGHRGGRLGAEPVDQRVFHAGPRRCEYVRRPRSSTTGWPAAGSSSRPPTPSPDASSSRRATPRRSRVRPCGASSRSTTPAFLAPSNCAVDSPTFGLDPYALYIGVVQFCDPGGVYTGTSGFVVRKTSVIDFATHRRDGVPQSDGDVGRRRSLRASGCGHRGRRDCDGLLHRRRQRVAWHTDAAAGRESWRDADHLVQHRRLRRLRPPSRSPCGTSAILARQMVSSTAVTTASCLRVIRTAACGRRTRSASRTPARRAAPPTRNGVRWYQIGTPTGTPTVVQSGTLFTAGSPGNFNQRNYWVPSIATTTGGRTIDRVQRGGQRASSSMPAWRSVCHLTRPARCARRNSTRRPRRRTTRPETRAPRRAADAGAVSRRRWSMAATARLSGRCNSSPMRSTPTASPLAAPSVPARPLRRLSIRRWSPAASRRST